MGNNAKGTTITFNSTALDGVTNIEWEEAGDEFDDTDLDSTVVTGENAITEQTCTVDLNGPTDLTRSTPPAALTQTFPSSGGTRSMTKARVASVSTSTPVRGKVTSRVVFKGSR